MIKGVVSGTRRVDVEEGWRNWYGYILENTDSTEMKKWTLLFVNGSECKILIYIKKELLQMCRDGRRVNMLGDYAGK